MSYANNFIPNNNMMGGMPNNNMMNNMQGMNNMGMNMNNMNNMPNIFIYDSNPLLLMIKSLK